MGNVNIFICILFGNNQKVLTIYTAFTIIYIKFYEKGCKNELY